MQRSRQEPDAIKEMSNFGVSMQSASLYSTARDDAMNSIVPAQ